MFDLFNKSQYNALYDIIIVNVFIFSMIFLKLVYPLLTKISVRLKLIEFYFIVFYYKLML